MEVFQPGHIPHVSVTCVTKVGPTGQSSVYAADRIGKALPPAPIVISRVIGANHAPRVGVSFLGLSRHQWHCLVVTICSQTEICIPTKEMTLQTGCGDVNIVLVGATFRLHSPLGVARKIRVCQGSRCLAGDKQCRLKMTPKLACLPDFRTDQVRPVIFIPCEPKCSSVVGRGKCFPAAARMSVTKA